MREEASQKTVHCTAYKKLTALSLLILTFGLGLTNSCQAPFDPSSPGNFASSGSNDFIQPPAGIELKFKCLDPSARGVADNRLRRLIKPELINTLNHLLGPEIVSLDSVQAQLGIMTADEVTTTVDELGQNHSSNHMKALFEIAAIAGDAAFENDSLRTKIFGECSGQENVTSQCAESFVTNFGLKVYRRPLTQEEINGIMTNFNSMGGVEGLKTALLQLLVAPPMTYHIEVGEAEVGSRIRLTDYEVASRISYRTIGTMPDEELFTAAKNGELQDLKNVKYHVRRLLVNHPLAKEKMKDFFKYYLQLIKVASPNEVVAAYRNIDTEGLQEEMMQEFEDFAFHIIFEKQGTFRDLLTSREVFPRSQRMARILETTIASGETPSLTTQEHKGLLLRPALLAGAGDRTNPMHRGVRLRRRVLCNQLGAPDPNAVTERAEEVGSIDDMPNRDGYHQLTNASNCLGCHTLINPLGFALEGYDQVGMLRTEELIFNSEGKIEARYPIDTNVEKPLLGGRNSPSQLAGASELVNALAEGDSARSCFAETLFEFQRMRVAEDADHCALREVERAATYEGTVLEAFEKAVATEDIFWKSL